MKNKKLGKHIDYVFNECRICAEHHNYGCSVCPHKKRCEQTHIQVKQLIQQSREKAEIDEKWIEERAIDLSNRIHLEGDTCSYVNMSEGFIRQIVAEVQKPKITLNIPHELDVIKDHFISANKKLEWIIDRLKGGKK